MSQDILWWISMRFPRKKRSFSEDKEQPQLNFIRQHTLSLSWNKRLLQGRRWEIHWELDAILGDWISSKTSLGPTSTQTLSQAHKALFASRLLDPSVSHQGGCFGEQEQTVRSCPGAWLCADQLPRPRNYLRKKKEPHQTQSKKRDATTISHRGTKTHSLALI